jgi:hypothetical protein
MQTLFTIVAILLILFLIFQSLIKMSTSGTEKQPYRVVKREKGMEIRFYPAATLASVQTSARNYRELANSSFRRVAGYIFGGNDASMKIAMTSPVHMDISDSGSSMGFVMPAEYHADDLPKPNDPGISILKTPDEYVAAITFSGFATDQSISEHAHELEKMLREKGIPFHGHFRYLGYNPPYQIIGRKNEVIVTVEWKE